MRTTDCDSNLSSDSSQLDLESPETDRRREEQSAYDDRRVDQLSSLRGGSVAGVDERSTSTRTRWTCGHPRLSGSWEGDTAARRKVVGVATPFIVGRPKSSDTDVSPSTDRDSRRQESSASSSLSSSSSSSFSAVTGGSVPDGYSRVARRVTSECDARRLIISCQQLSDSPFYVAELSSKDARGRLRTCSPGTFIVRDSAHPSHLYSISVKTLRGVTSVRTVYDVDRFRLDSDPEQAEWMASFDSVVALVSHYVDESRTSSESGRRRRSSCVFVDRSGRRDLPVVLSTPYRARPASLRHLCRLSINVALDGRAADRLCVVPSLRTYLQQHPFRV